MADRMSDQNRLRDNISKVIELAQVGERNAFLERILERAKEIAAECRDIGSVGGNTYGIMDYTAFKVRPSDNPCNETTLGYINPVKLALITMGYLTLERPDLIEPFYGDHDEFVQDKVLLEQLNIGY